ncbi:MAG: hypothetical protein J3K34DRAFT_459006 [Monoraphidium minutum]|nr:MAG: hypothetical protein J3K34DRAFT_459006 [Monoraphidium minutum]
MDGAGALLAPPLALATERPSADGDGAAPQQPVAAGGGGDGAQEGGSALPACRLMSVLGLDVSRRHNLLALDADTLALAAGNTLLLLHLPTMAQRHLPTRDGGGIGAIALHPRRTHFAVAEKCSQRPPNIYVYEWPSLALAATLPCGTERAYTAVEFDGEGGLLAAVGGAPDYLLTLWAWREGAVVLRAKAFSQDVYSVRFSPYFPGRLVTSGTGHVRFWRMASTFTGLKLQGALGKFGGLELSDIAAFAELPDGKVLSGSEAGSLLLWDDGVIKALVARPGGAPCHAGAVEALLYDEATSTALSGGADGMLRLWEVAHIDAEPPEQLGGGGSGPAVVEVRPSAEIALPAGARVRCLLWLDRRTWLVADDAGGLLRVSVPANMLDAGAYACTRLFDCHAGRVAGLAALPDCHVAVTAGADGSVRAFDYTSGAALQARRFAAPATCMAVLPPEGARFCIAVGFADGAVRCLQRCSDGWLLLAAHRPHTAAVVAVAVARGGGRAATVAADGTAFFFDAPAPESWRPLGFCRLPDGTPSCADWAVGRPALVVGCSSGSVVEVQAPDGTADTTSTFHLQLGMRSCTVRLPRGWPSLAQHGEQASVAGSTPDQPSAAVPLPSEDGATPEPAEAAGSAPVAGGVADSSSSSSPGAASWGLEADAAPAAPITWLTCSPGGGSAFRVCLGGSAAGRVWESSFEDPAPRSCFAVIASAPTTAIATSRSGRYQLLGSTDGMVRVEQQSSGSPGDRPGIGSWEARLHGMQTGSVTGLAMAFDDSCFLSATADGTLVAVDNALGGSPQRQQGVPPPLLPMSAAGAPAAEDLGGGAASLEEGKQAAVADALAAQAAQARDGLRGEFDALRAELAALLAANAARPAGEQLPRSMFIIDPGLAALAEAERAAKLEDARAQVAWDAERAARLLQQLGVFFAPQLAASNFVLRPLEGRRGAAVQSAALPQLPPEVQAEVTPAAVWPAAPGGDIGSAGGPAGQGSLQRDRSKVHRQVSIDSRTAAGSAPAGVNGCGQATAGAESLQSAASKATLQCEARREREAQWAALMASKPDPGVEAPEDVAAMREAEAGIGDLRLRSAPGYVPDEDQRMTPARKRQQMAVLARRMGDEREAFNSDLLALRDDKRALLRRLADIDGRLGTIGERLQISAAPAELAPAMAPDEEPNERRGSVDQQQLAAWKRVEQQRTGGGPAAGGFGGFAAPGGDAGASAGQGSATAKPPTFSVASPRPALAAPSASAAAATPASAALPAVALSDLEQSEAGVSRRWLEAERDQLQCERQRLCSQFDAALARLRARRLELECGLSSCQARLLVHYHQLVLLKEFEKRELMLLAKSADKASERGELQGRLADLARQMDTKHAESESVAAARAAVVAEFDAMVGEKAPFREQLAHIFNRRIKRSAKRGGAAQGDAAGNSSDDDDLDAFDNDGGDEGDDDDGGHEVCPPGCKQALYERVCELREARLDEEDAAGEVARAAEGLRKEREVLAKKGRVIEQSVAAINQDMLEFQREKQAALNEVPVEVALRAHQVQCLAEGQAPPAGAGLAEVVVLSQASLERLAARIQGLEDEKEALRGVQKDLRRRNVTLGEEQAAKQAQLREQQARCRDVQLLKFGREIDVAFLDTIGLRNHAADDLRVSLKQQEHAQARDLAELEAVAAARTRELLVLTRDNTAALNTVSDLTRSQRGLEAEVLSHKAGLFEDQLHSRRAAVAKRDALVTAVTANAATLTQLRATKDALRRKPRLGGRGSVGGPRFGGLARRADTFIAELNDTHIEAGLRLRHTPPELSIPEVVRGYAASRRRLIVLGYSSTMMHVAEAGGVERATCARFWTGSLGSANSRTQVHACTSWRVFLSRCDFICNIFIHAASPPIQMHKLEEAFGALPLWLAAENGIYLRPPPGAGAGGARNGGGGGSASVMTSQPLAAAARDAAVAAAAAPPAAAARAPLPGIEEGPAEALGAPAAARCGGTAGGPAAPGPSGPPPPPAGSAALPTCFANGVAAAGPARPAWSPERPQGRRPWLRPQLSAPADLLCDSLLGGAGQLPYWLDQTAPATAATFEPAAEAEAGAASGGGPPPPAVAASWLGSGGDGSTSGSSGGGAGGSGFGSRSASGGGGMMRKPPPSLVPPRPAAPAAVGLPPTPKTPPPAIAAAAAAAGLKAPGRSPLLQRAASCGAAAGASPQPPPPPPRRPSAPAAAAGGAPARPRPGGGGAAPGARDAEGLGRLARAHLPPRHLFTCAVHLFTCARSNARSSLAGPGEVLALLEELARASAPAGGGAAGGAAALRPAARPRRGCGQLAQFSDVMGVVPSGDGRPGPCGGPGGGGGGGAAASRPARGSGGGDGGRGVLPAGPPLKGEAYGFGGGGGGAPRQEPPPTPLPLLQQQQPAPPPPPPPQQQQQQQQQQQSGSPPPLPLAPHAAPPPQSDGCSRSAGPAGARTATGAAAHPTRSALCLRRRVASHSLEAAPYRRRQNAFT